MSGPPAPIAMRKAPRFGALWPVVLIALAAAAAYANSFSGPFIFDDLVSVIDNRSIRNFGTAFRPDHGLGQTVEGRPILNLSLALNYAVSGTRVWSYHLLNLLIHVLAGLTLFGVVRRTLERWSSSATTRSPAGDAAKRIGADALPLALAIALIWTVHPLQTESVTYVVQRAESLMGLFFLFTFYAFIRSLDGARAGLWRGLCVASFLLGVGTKEVIVTALPLLLLYDSVFVSGSLAKAWRARRGLWIGLACCLIVLAAQMASTGWNRSGTIGLVAGEYPFAYALTQPPALLTYLKLCVLPFPLVFEYGTFWIPFGREFCLQATVIAALLALTAGALKRAPALGFIGSWFFVILAPTSLVPGTLQMIVEHRMYLPLAAVVTLLSLALHRLLGGRCFPVLLAIVAAFGWLTTRRNEAYRTQIGIWGDTVVKRPNNERARYNLGVALGAEGRTSEAIAQYEEALRLKPHYEEAHFNLGIAFSAAGRTPEAIAQYEEALRLKPGDAEAHNNLAIALRSEGRTTEAITQYEDALHLKPDYAEAHDNLAMALRSEGRTAEAITEYQEALRLKPDVAGTHGRLGNALSDQGRIADAIVQYGEALRLKAGDADAHNNLAIVLETIPGRLNEAIAQYEEAVRLRPDAAGFHLNLALALMKIPGRTDEAAAHLNAVLRIQPDNEQARRLLAGIEKLGP